MMFLDARWMRSCSLAGKVAGSGEIARDHVIRVFLWSRRPTYSCRLFDINNMHMSDLLFVRAMLILCWCHSMINYRCTFPFVK